MSAEGEAASEEAPVITFMKKKPRNKNMRKRKATEEEEEAEEGSSVKTQKVREKKGLSSTTKTEREVMRRSVRHAR